MSAIPSIIAIPFNALTPLSAEPFTSDEESSWIPTGVNEPLAWSSTVMLFEDGCPMAAPEPIDEEPSMQTDPFWLSRPQRRICVLCDGNCECEVDQTPPLHKCGECDAYYTCNLWDPKHGCCADCDNFPECAVCVHLCMVESFHNGGMMSPVDQSHVPIAVASDQKLRDKERKLAERAVAKELRQSLALQKRELKEQANALKTAEKLHKQELLEQKRALKAAEKERKVHIRAHLAAQKEQALALKKALSATKAAEKETTRLQKIAAKEALKATKAAEKKNKQASPMDE